MINLFPEPKKQWDGHGRTQPFTAIAVEGADAHLMEVVRLRLWNYQDIAVRDGVEGQEGQGALRLDLSQSLDGVGPDENPLYRQQGYHLDISEGRALLQYEQRAGLVNGLTSLKMLLQQDAQGYFLPVCRLIDYPSIPVRAVAPTFSWYAGYGRIGFDSQLWGLVQWTEFLNVCLDNKINQFNMVMYGYWPFAFERYPETVLRDVPMKIWNAENKCWLDIAYTHPNIAAPYLQQFIELAHRMGVRIFAYVGLNSYNGGYSIKHPQARTKPPQSGKFLNDFDSLCLSYPGTVDYILDCMEHIARLGFDGFTLEESEEGFWYCECDACRSIWHAGAVSPGEAKHHANLWLLQQIYDRVRSVNPQAVLGIRAFRQPPLEKDPAFLKECVQQLPRDINLFWAPGLYVPEGEFKKWCDAFGRQRIWGRDTEANSITSTMGRLYRTFKTNMIRYEDEPNEQVIETDIRQHLGSVKMGVHGINGFMFEWYGLFMHLFAHGNYGWGSTLRPQAFYRRVCELNFGPMGRKVLHLLRSILTIHESQMALYTTPFPFQKNKIVDGDIPAIIKAQRALPGLARELDAIQSYCQDRPPLRHWVMHFDKIRNALRRNGVIYQMMLTSLDYERAQDAQEKERLLDRILELNEADFDIVKEMFFDINPVAETGVKSCMYPYHEIKRLIHNIRHPQAPDEGIICSGIEALGWLWL